MGALSDDQLAEVTRCVRIVVDRDRDELQRRLHPGVDLYLWTRGHAGHRQVDLVAPPGHAADWEITTVEVAVGDRPEVSVLVDMWTRQEGRSDLTLELLLTAEDGGGWLGSIVDLHVL